MQYITQFITNLSLEINISKSHLIHHSKGILFLGYNIQGGYTFNKAKETLHPCSRVSYVKLKFTIPTERLLKRYKERGFLRIAKKGISKRRLVARRVDK